METSSSDEQGAFVLPSPPPPATTSSERHAMMLHEARLVCSHIGRQIARRTQQHGGGAEQRRPLIVGMQGPQGSGKTTITAAVQDMLKEQGLKSAVFSLDDIYLPHDGLVKVAQGHPDNKLLQGRGQPGTHDMALGTRLLKELQENESGGTVHLPIFNKSAHDGQGDRSAETKDVEMPVDVVLFEGWCLGFYPLPDDELKRRYEEAILSQKETRSDETPFFAQHPLTSLLQVNEALRGFLEWYKHMHAFVQLRPDHLHNVFAWRLQTEHKMKAKGKAGMTDEQVHDFVARYMPGYELFGEGVSRADAPWAGHGLRIDLDKTRNVVGQAMF